MIHAAPVNLSKIQRELEQHWDIDFETFDSWPAVQIHPQVLTDGSKNGWFEVVFKNEDGTEICFAEVSPDSGVWNFDWI